MCEAALTTSIVGALICEGRRENHKGMHHDYNKRVYWLVRSDGTVDFLEESPRT